MLPVATQKEVQEWMVWFAGQSENDKEKIGYRPPRFGVYSEQNVELSLKMVDSSIIQTVKDYCGDPQKWWEWFYSLPEKDPVISQDSLMNWLTIFSQMTKEEQNTISYSPFCVEARRLSDEQIEEKLKDMDDAVIKVVEGHVADPLDWWDGYFLLPDEDDLMSQIQIKDWLVWYAGLTEQDQERVDSRTHLFFAAWE